MREKAVVRNYTTIVRAQESFFKQKARIHWFSIGDQILDGRIKVVLPFLAVPYQAAFVF